MKKTLFAVCIIALCACVTLSYAQEQKPAEPVKEAAAVEAAAPADADMPAAPAAPAFPKEDPKDKTTVILAVDGASIYRSEVIDGVNYNVLMRKTVSEEDFAAILKNVEDYLIDLALVLSAANKAGVKVTDEELNAKYTQLMDSYRMTEDKFNEMLKERGIGAEDFKNTFRDGVKREAFLRDKIEAQVSVTDEEAKEFYESHKQMMVQPESVTVSHILIKSEKEDPEKKAQIDDILKKIKSGENFEKLAKNFSDCPSGKEGGSLGAVYRGQTVKEFEDIAFKLEVGQLSDAFKTQYGYHILKVTDKKPESVTPFEEAKPSIVNHLKKPKRKALFEKYIKELREKAEIKVYEEQQLKYADYVSEDKRPKPEEAPAKNDASEKDKPMPSQPSAAAPEQPKDKPAK